MPAGLILDAQNRRTSVSAEAFRFFIGSLAPGKAANSKQNQNQIRTK
jgi:hypothetical protein